MNNWFCFHEKLIKIVQATIALGVGEDQFFEGFPSVCEKLAHQKDFVPISAPLDDDKMDGTKKVQKYFSEAETTEMLNAVCGFLSAKICQLSKRSSKICF